MFGQSGPVQTGCCDELCDGLCQLSGTWPVVDQATGEGPTWWRYLTRLVTRSCLFFLFLSSTYKSIYIYHTLLIYSKSSHNTALLSTVLILAVYPLASANYLFSTADLTLGILGNYGISIAEEVKGERR
ncbi:hypothetical protein V8F06_004759 [Rhypophila decipiens]